MKIEIDKISIIFGIALSSLFVLIKHTGNTYLIETFVVFVIYLLMEQSIFKKIHKYNGEDKK